MKFEELIKQRQKYHLLSGKKDELYNAIIENSYDYDFALLTPGIININSKELFKNNYIDIIIQIPSPFAYTGCNFILLHFTKTKPKKILTGVFTGIICKKNNKNIPCNSNWYLKGEITEDFSSFINNINLFLNDKKIERNDLNIIDFSLFDITHLNPIYYTPQAIKVREELKSCDYELLEDIADIIYSPTERNIEGKYINSKNFIYPLKYDELPFTKIARAIKVKKGDIIGLLVGEQNKFYLYNENFEDIYVKASNYCIIRVKNEKIRKYLVNYLNDEKVRIYFASNKKNSVMPLLTINELIKLKVIIPTEEMIKTANEIIEYEMNSKQLSTSKINELIRNLNKYYFKNESQRMISEDIINYISKLKNKAIKELINDDLNEVEICFDNKAYKSAIILCGSILEAILLDWLSEYENTDDILNVAKNDDGRDLDLSKIIYKLKDIVKPYWYEATKAHEIRKTRNMVHPKECLKNNIKVTYEECRKIIDDLKDIIESKISRN